MGQITWADVLSSLPKVAGYPFAIEQSYRFYIYFSNSAITSGAQSKTGSSSYWVFI